MAQDDIPPGGRTKASQADGTPESRPSAEAVEAEEPFLFTVGSVWEGDGAGRGEVRVASGSFSIPIGGPKELGGSGEGASPEELLLAAVGACFSTTWAIFLKKLGLAYAEPSLRVAGELAKDPAGGYRMAKATIRARVPASLLADRRREVEKTLQLAEKYCIVSKVVRASIPLEVVIEEV
jgi:organic hydroperoxide reductase OsmC/OhrA